MRAIRGAISIDENSKKKILADTKKLLVEMIQKNNIDQEEIVSIEFTATRDLDEVYPAVSARKIGLMNIPLLCFQEMHVKKSLEKCIRIMIYINRDCSLDDINHVYLKKAEQLRPDLT
ncbi:MAG: chorismate mutase [Bacillota bacterium]